jgi:hypothetical protein
LVRGGFPWQLTKLPGPRQSVVLGKVLTPGEAVKYWLVKVTHLMKEKVVAIVTANLPGCPHLKMSAVPNLPTVTPRCIMAARKH